MELPAIETLKFNLYRFIAASGTGGFIDIESSSLGDSIQQRNLKRVRYLCIADQEGLGHYDDNLIKDILPIISWSSNLDLLGLEILFTVSDGIYVATKSNQP